MERLRIIGKAILEQGGFFSLDQVTKATKIDRIEVRRVMEKLCRERILKTIRILPKDYVQEKGRPRTQVIYKLRNKPRLEARIAPKLKEGTAQDRMWSVVRNKNQSEGTFRVQDLMTLGAVKYELARWFVKMLRRAGFIQPSRNAGPGVEWRLVKDPGPRRPYVGDQVKKCGMRNADCGLKPKI